MKEKKIQKNDRRKLGISKKKETEITVDLETCRRI
jgi:hypothetical protein